MIKTNDKGFTLIEILGVIAVIAILLAIAVPTMGGIIKNYRNDAYNAQVKLLEKEVESWSANNLATLPTTADEMIFLTIEELINGGYIDNETVRDPRSNGILNGCVMVRLDTATSQYEYKYNDMDCSVLAEEYKPTYTVSGNTEVEVNTTYTLPVVTAVSASGVDLTVTEPVIKNNGVVVENILTAKVGDKYILEYGAFDPDKSYNYEKFVEVKVVDTTKPVITFASDSGVQKDEKEYYINVSLGSSFTPPTVIVKDNSCGESGVDTSVNNCNKTLKATTQGLYNVFIPDDYEYTYYAVDSSGNQAALVLHIKVIE